LIKRRQLNILNILQLRIFFFKEVIYFINFNDKLIKVYNSLNCSENKETKESLKETVQQTKIPKIVKADRISKKDSHIGISDNEFHNKSEDLAKEKFTRGNMIKNQESSSLNDIDRWFYLNLKFN